MFINLDEKKVGKLNETNFRTTLSAVNKVIIQYSIKFNSKKVIS